MSLQSKPAAPPITASPIRSRYRQRMAKHSDDPGTADLFPAELDRAAAFILEEEDQATGPTARQARYRRAQRALGRYKFTVWATRPEAARLERLLSGLRLSGWRGFLLRWLLRPFLEDT